MRGARRHARRPGIGWLLAALAAAVAVLVGTGAALVALGADGSAGAASSLSSSATISPTPTGTPSSVVSSSPSPGDVPPERYEVSVTHLRLVDRHRAVAGVGSDEDRILPTTVWYPDTTHVSPVPATGTDVASSFPLVVFAHGFDLFPSTYARLLRAWARAGYVVAAPVFPRTNPDASGGLDEADLVNQPEDVRFVITRLLERSTASSGPLSGLIDASAIAVAGHSDGGETALAAAYDTCCRDRRIGAAIVLAGAQLPVEGGRYLRAHGPPLFAAQGTADTVNDPSETRVLYDGAPTPKYLLWLHGADHLGPFTTVAPFEPVVRRLTIEFLDRYLRGIDTPIRVPRAARTAGVATLRVDVPAGGSTG
ncbi:MAG: alpha/beta hydrolase family protein [Actinomycetota bacterium]